MKSLTQRGLAIVLCPLMAFSGMPATAWAAKEVACESSGMRRTYCATGAHGDIRLSSNVGQWPCTQDDTWGIEPEGIWVDQNCRGRFSVDDPKRDDNSKAAVVAGIIGIGVLAAIAANHNKKDDAGEWNDREPVRDRPGRPQDPPDWMVGEYAGYNNFYKADLSMRVSPGGRISTRSGNTGQQGRYIGDRTIQFEDGKRFQVDRTRGGIRLQELGNRRNVSDLARQR